MEMVNVILTIVSAHKIRPHSIWVSGPLPPHATSRQTGAHATQSGNLPNRDPRLAPEFVPDVREGGKLMVRIQKRFAVSANPYDNERDHLARTFTNACHTRSNDDCSVYAKFSRPNRPASILCTPVDDILICGF